MYFSLIKQPGLKFYSKISFCHQIQCIGCQTQVLLTEFKGKLKSVICLMCITKKQWCIDTQQFGHKVRVGSATPLQNQNQIKSESNNHPPFLVRSTTALMQLCAIYPFLSKDIPNSWLLLKLFYLLPMWLTTENILMHVFSV